MSAIRHFKTVAIMTKEETEAEAYSLMERELFIFLGRTKCAYVQMYKTIKWTSEKTLIVINYYLLIFQLNIHSKYAF